MNNTIFALALVVFLGLAILAVLYFTQQATPTLSAAQDFEATPGVNGEPAEVDDSDRPTNPANPERQSLETLLEVIRESHEIARVPLTMGAGYAPQKPDEPVEDQPESSDEEPEPVPAALVGEVIHTPFVIQSPDTDEQPVEFGKLATAYPVDDEDRRHTGWTGFIPRITDEDIAAEQARHDAAALLTEARVA